MRRIIIAIVILAILGVGGYFGYQQFAAPEPAAETADPITAANTSPVNTGLGVVSAEGEVVPLRDVALSFQVGGTVAEILVREGDHVGTGDPLIRLDADTITLARDQAAAGVQAAESALAAAQAQLTAAQGRVTTAEVGVRAAEAQLALVQAGPRAEQVKAAQDGVAGAQAGVFQAAAGRDATLQIRDSQVHAAEANVAAQQGRVKAIEDQYEAILDNCFKVTTPEGEEKEVCPQYGPVEEAKRAELEQARLELQAAQAALDALQAGPTSGQRAAASGSVAVAQANQQLAEAQLALTLAGATAEQVQQVEVGVEQAQTAVAQAQAGVVQAEAAVAQAEAGVVNAQAALDAAEAALARTVLTATFDGTVGQINTELGELVSPGLPVVTIADFGGWQVKTTDLTELDVVSVALGQPVEVQIDALPNTVLNGTVSDISAVATLSRGDVTYDVVIDVDNSDGLPLRWGMTAFVDIDVAD